MDIKTELEKLTNDQMRLLFITEETKKLPSPFKEYILEGKKDYSMGKRINEIEKISIDIVIKRFINKTLN